MTGCAWVGVGLHRDVCPWPDGLEARVDWLAVHGSSLVMNWSYDDRTWEVSWINLGARTTAIASDLSRAIARVYEIVVLAI